MTRLIAFGGIVLMVTGGYLIMTRLPITGIGCFLIGGLIFWLAWCRAEATELTRRGYR